MPARLVPLIPGSAPIVPLSRPVLLVGRHPECDVRFDLPSVSRRHCCLALAYDRLTIRDLGSRHGVRVNGEPRDESRLQSGDEIAIGPLLFRFEDEPGPPPACGQPRRGQAQGRDDAPEPSRHAGRRRRPHAPERAVPALCRLVRTPQDAPPPASELPLADSSTCLRTSSGRYFTGSVPWLSDGLVVAAERELFALLALDRLPQPVEGRRGRRNRSRAGRT